jgi:hypothetical protein
VEITQDHVRFSLPDVSVRLNDDVDIVRDIWRASCGR